MLVSVWEEKNRVGKVVLFLVLQLLAYIFFRIDIFPCVRVLFESNFIPANSLQAETEEGSGWRHEEAIQSKTGFIKRRGAVWIQPMSSVGGTAEPEIGQATLPETWRMRNIKQERLWTRKYIK